MCVEQRAAFPMGQDSRLLIARTTLSCGYVFGHVNHGTRHLRYAVYLCLTYPSNLMSIKAELCLNVIPNISASSRLRLSISPILVKECLQCFFHISVYLS